MKMTGNPEFSVKKIDKNQLIAIVAFIFTIFSDFLSERWIFYLYSQKTQKSSEIKSFTTQFLIRNRLETLEKGWLMQRNRRKGLKNYEKLQLKCSKVRKKLPICYWIKKLDRFWVLRPRYKTDLNETSIGVRKTAEMDFIYENTLTSKGKSLTLYD